MALEHVAGRKSGKIVLYGLSTCPWCAKAKKLLSDLGVDYYFTDVDQASEAEKRSLLDSVRKWNPACSFPTLVFDDKKCVVGFKADEIREAVKA